MSRSDLSSVASFLGEWIANHRANNGETLRQAGERAGIPFGTLARLERGDGPTSLDNALRVALWTGDGRELFDTLIAIAEQDQPDCDGGDRGD